MTNLLHTTNHRTNPSKYAPIWVIFTNSSCFVKQVQVIFHDLDSKDAQTFYLPYDYIAGIVDLSYTALLKLCKKHGFTQPIEIPPTDNTDNKTDTSCFIERSDAVGVVDCVGVAQHSSECRSTSPVEGSAFTEQDNKDFPKWGVTLRGLPLPTQAPPLTAENKNNSFIFRIMNDTHWVVLRHDWDDKNIYIHSAKYQTTFFEMCTQDNEKRSIAVPYTPHNLTLLLSARTCPALIHLAQSLSNDAQEVEQ